MQVRRLDKTCLPVVFYCLSLVYTMAIDQPFSRDTYQVCAFGTGDVTTSCTKFDIVCNTSTLVEILNAICGIRHDSHHYNLCYRQSDDCKIYNDCCRKEQGDKWGKMHAIHRAQLSRRCTRKSECHVLAPVQPLAQEVDTYTVHYCSVLYRCVPVTTTFTPTRQHDYTQIMGRSDLPCTPENNMSSIFAKTYIQAASPSVSLTAIVVPVIVVFMAVVTGTALILRRRCLNSNRSPDAAKHNSEHRISNNYDSLPSPDLTLPCSVSIVHRTASDDLAASSKDTLCNIKNRDCNNYITFDSENLPDIDKSSNVCHVAEGQDPYNIIDSEHAKRGYVLKQSKERETSSGYHAIDFKSEMARNDQNNYYAEMTGQSSTEDYVNLEIDEDDKDIPFDADHSPYHIIDPHDPYTARAFLQIERQSLESNVGSTTPGIDKEVYTPNADVNPYHILEPLETNTISDTKHIHEQMPEVTVETSADDNDYNKISFKINNVTTDMRSGTMRTIVSDDISDYSHLYGNEIRELSVNFLHNAVEYSHLGDNNTGPAKVMCDSDDQYSHISLSQETRPRVF